MVVCLVLILTAVATDRLLPLRGAAEANRFEQTVAAMRAGLGSAAVDRALHPAQGDLAALAGSNPLSLLATGPAYASGPALPDHGIAPGSWFFATRSGTLYYRVEYPQYFTGGYGDPPLIRLRIAWGGATQDAGRQDLRLDVLDDYAWKPSGDVKKALTPAP